MFLNLDINLFTTKCWQLFCEFIQENTSKVLVSLPFWNRWLYYFLVAISCIYSKLLDNYIFVFLIWLRYFSSVLTYELSFLRHTHTQPNTQKTKHFGTFFIVSTHGSILQSFDGEFLNTLFILFIIKLFHRSLMTRKNIL